MTRTAQIPADLLARMSSAAGARATANATIIEATRYAARFMAHEVELHEAGHISTGTVTARMMQDESGYAYEVCHEALCRLVDADEAVVTFDGLHNRFRPATDDDR
jgi:hypothetical protein